MASQLLRSARILVCTSLIFGTLADPAVAQQTAGQSAAGGKPSAIAQPSVYAVNAAALSAAMTFCNTKYRNIAQGSAGADCLARTRNALTDMKLADWAAGIDRKCGKSESYNRCITPEIGRLVYALNDTFSARGF